MTTYVKIKPGLDISELSPKMTDKLWVIASVFDMYGIEPVMTSARRRAQGNFSYHHTGKALDFRANHIKGRNTQIKILSTLKQKLGKDFDVVLHGKGNNLHYHIEYDPK